jgi:hypothetical protein
MTLQRLKQLVYILWFGQQYDVAYRLPETLIKSEHVMKVCVRTSIWNAGLKPIENMFVVTNDHLPRLFAHTATGKSQRGQL